jgi:rhodanese-related sulfurtransferase
LLLHDLTKVAEMAAQRITIDDMLGRARARIERVEPVKAFRELAAGAQLIDIRCEAARRDDGIVPGSFHIPRTVLEWRLDPDSPWRNPHVGGLETRFLVFCDHGYSSSLAAATLVELGFSRAADVIGGFAGWKEAGLPMASAPPSELGELPGMGPPELFGE